MTNEDRKPVVVFDSNFWIAHHMLRRDGGSALRFFLRLQGIPLILPEIVEEEVKTQIASQLVKNSEEIQATYEFLLSQTAKLPALVLPSTDELRHVARGVFDDLGVEIIRVPLSLKATWDALGKTIRHEPPNTDRKEQFRDGVIWGVCIQQAADSPVFFATEDLDFVDKGKDSAKLQPNLLAESKAANYEVTLFRRLGLLIDGLRTKIGIELSSVHDLCGPHSVDQLKTLRDLGFRQGDVKCGTYKVFATEDAAVAVIQVRVDYEWLHATRGPASVRVNGECLFDNPSGRISKFRSSDIEVKFARGDPGRPLSQTTARVGPLTIGHATTEYRLRIEIDEGELA